MRSRVLAGILLAAGWPAAAQTAPPADSGLLTLSYEKWADRTRMAAYVTLVRDDTATGPAAPDLMSFPILVLAGWYAGSARDGTARNAEANIGWFTKRPRPEVRSLGITVGDSVLPPVAARIFCQTSPSGDRGFALTAPLPPSVLARIAAASVVRLTAGEERFSIADGQMDAVRAFAARIKADTSANGSDSLGRDTLALHEFMVDRPVLVKKSVVPDQGWRAGEITVQFIVDTTGRAEMSSFKVIKASSTEVSTKDGEAVARVLPSWRFSPALVCGEPVKQYVRLPFVFGGVIVH